LSTGRGETWWTGETGIKVGGLGLDVGGGGSEAPMSVGIRAAKRWQPADVSAGGSV